MQSSAISIRCVSWRELAVYVVIVVQRERDCTEMAFALSSPRRFTSIASCRDEEHRCEGAENSSSRKSERESAISLNAAIVDLAQLVSPHVWKSAWPVVGPLLCLILLRLQLLTQKVEPLLRAPGCFGGAMSGTSDQDELEVFVCLDQLAYYLRC